MKSKCKHCGITFEHGYSSLPRKFCGIACAKLGKNKSVLYHGELLSKTSKLVKTPEIFSSKNVNTFVCKNCDKSFTRTGKGAIMAQYCCRECMNDFHRNHFRIDGKRLTRKIG